MKENGSSGDLIPEEFGRSPSLVPNDEALLPTSFDFEDLHHGAITRLYAPEDFLVDFKRIIGRFFEENRIGDGPDVGLSAKCF